MIWDIRVLDVNEAVIKKYGYTKEEFLKMTVKEIWPEEDYLFFEGVHSFNQYKNNFKKKILKTSEKKSRHNKC
jgi:PAS domain S-box-containing protein